jgi:hypothetical protein
VPKIRKYQTKPNKLVAAPLANTWFWEKYIHNEPKRLVMPRSLLVSQHCLKRTLKGHQALICKRRMWVRLRQNHWWEFSGSQRKRSIL